MVLNIYPEYDYLLMGVCHPVDSSLFPGSDPSGCISSGPLF